MVLSVQEDVGSITRNGAKVHSVVQLHSCTTMFGRSGIPSFVGVGLISMFPISEKLLNSDSLS